MCTTQGDLFAVLGEDALLQISTAFYERVYADPVLRGVFASATKKDAIANQVLNAQRVWEPHCASVSCIQDCDIIRVCQRSNTK